MPKYRYLLEYLPGMLYASSKEFDLDAIRAAVDSFALIHANPEEALTIDLVSMQELGDEQGYPGGTKVSVYFHMDCENADDAFEGALDVMRLLNFHLSLKLEINPVVINPDLSAITPLGG